MCLRLGLISVLCRLLYQTGQQREAGCSVGEVFLLVSAQVGVSGSRDRTLVALPALLGGESPRFSLSLPLPSRRAPQSTPECSCTGLLRRQEASPEVRRSLRQVRGTKQGPQARPEVARSRGA